MIGQFLALLSAVSLSASSVSVRKAVFRIGESNAPFYISIFVGMIIFSLALAFSGDGGQLTTASVKALASLVGAGIIGMSMGRWLTFNSLRLIGSNITSPVSRISAVVAVTLGITVMNEPVTVGVILSVAFIVTGVVLISTEGGSTRGPDITKARGDMTKGIASALLAGTCYGIGTFLIKIAIEEGNSPIMSGFVSYSTATVLVLVILSRHSERQKLKKVDRAAFVPVLFGSIFASTAQFCRYWALDYSPVSVVSPLTATSTLITILLSFAINRRIEVFTWKIIVGAIFVVCGVFLIFQV
jgi:drug/metabolite transporter (DMT)-like permease